MTTVTDAIHGLATWVPGRGYLVSEVRQADITEVQQAREALEAVALHAARPPGFGPNASSDARCVVPRVVRGRVHTASLHQRPGHDGGVASKIACVTLIGGASSDSEGGGHGH
jgi:hypothetical protein